MAGCLPAACLQPVGAPMGQAASASPRPVSLPTLPGRQHRCPGLPVLRQAGRTPCLAQLPSPRSCAGPGTGAASDSPRQEPGQRAPFSATVSPTGPSGPGDKGPALGTSSAELSLFKASGWCGTHRAAPSPAEGVGVWPGPPSKAGAPPLYPGVGSCRHIPLGSYLRVCRQLCASQQLPQGSGLSGSALRRVLGPGTLPPPGIPMLAAPRRPRAQHHVTLGLAHVGAVPHASPVPDAHPEPTELLSELGMRHSAHAAMCSPNGRVCC